ncbi:MAG: hypothetical protein COB37_00060 [Kordiimonadales bacterium]|nr:MAG: hypothetical protein COB37_00060 [Kordiimonadales bacterium]
MRALILALATCMVAAPLMAEDGKATLTVTELITSDIEGVASHSALVSKVFIPKGTIFPRHTHPTEEFLTVLSGEVVLKIDGQPDQTLKAGAAVVIPAKYVHSAVTPTHDTEVMVFRVHPKGQPVATPDTTEKD